METSSINPAKGTVPTKTPAQRASRARQLYNYHRQNSGMAWFDAKTLKDETRKLARKISRNSEYPSDDYTAMLYLDAISIRMGFVLKWLD